MLDAAAATAAAVSLIVLVGKLIKQHGQLMSVAVIYEKMLLR